MEKMMVKGIKHFLTKSNFFSGKVIEQNLSIVNETVDRDEPYLAIPLNGYNK